MPLFVCQSLETRRLLSVVTTDSDSFETQLSPFQSNGSSASWAIVETGVGNVYAHSGRQMVYAAGQGYVIVNGYPTIPANTLTELTNYYNLRGDTNAFLSFWYNIPSIGSAGELQVFTNNGYSSPPLITINTATNGWEESTVDLSAYAGSGTGIEFVYSGSGGQGAFLDDVSVWTDVPGETVAPTATLSAPVSNITAGTSNPVAFQVEYQDNVALEPDSLEAAEVDVLDNGTKMGQATLVNSDVVSASDMVDTFNFLPSSGQWDSSADGAYTMQIPKSTIFDTSGNGVAAGVLGTFDCRIAGAIDVAAAKYQAFAGLQSDALADGAPLTTQGITLSSSNGLAGVSYTADFYIADATTITASAPGTEIGQMDFETAADTFSGSEITLDAGAAGITIPSDLQPGVYTLGVHVTSDDPNFPDTNDANNWAPTDYVTVRIVPKNPTIVSVMVLYTPAAETHFGSDAAIQQQINSAINTANTAFLNSDIDVQLQLAYAGEIAYAETGDPQTDLVRLATPDDGYLDNVQALRQQYAANVVSLWTNTTYSSTIGIAYITGAENDADIAYNVVVASEMDAYTFAHEVGHNFGAGHAVGDSSGDNADQGLYAYSHGYRFTDPAETFDQLHDIMSYPPGSTIPFYSNPNVDYLGVPTGTAGANNALTISEDAATVAGYDMPVATISASAPTPNASEAGPTPGVFRITATIPTAVETDLTIQVPLTYSASPSVNDYQSPPDSVTITIPAGSLSASSDITITPIDDMVHEDNEALVLNIGQSDNGAFTTGNGSATIAIADNDPVVTVDASAPQPNAVEAGPVDGTFRITASIGQISTHDISLTVPLGYGGSPAESDYQTPVRSVQLTIPAGQLSASGDITITPIDDVIHEESESVTMTIVSSYEYTIGTASARINIADNDPLPAVTVSASAPTPVASEAGPVNGVFRVTADITSVYGLPVTVNVPLSYAGSPGQLDYRTPTELISVTIPAGSLSASRDIVVVPNDDGVHEDNEILTMTVGAGDGYSVGTATASISIADNDPQSIVLSTNNLTIEAGASNSVQVNLGTQPIASVIVAIEQTSGSAPVDLKTTLLTFTLANWSVPQAIVLAADSKASTGSATFTVSADGLLKTFTIDLENLAAPMIGSVSPMDGSVSKKGTYQLNAAGVAAGQDGGPVRVVFYRDSKDTGVFSASDAVVGTDKSAGGGWSVKAKAKQLQAGENMFFAVAMDAKGQSSSPVSCSLMVVDEPPMIKKFTAKVSRNNFVTLTASASDLDGSVTQLIAWVDSNGNDLPDAGEESFKGKSSLHARFAAVAGESYTFMAIAYDNDGMASSVKQVEFVG